MEKKKLTDFFTNFTTSCQLSALITWPGSLDFTATWWPAFFVVTLPIFKRATPAFIIWT